MEVAYRQSLDVSAHRSGLAARQMSVTSRDMHMALGIACHEGQIGPIVRMKTNRKADTIMFIVGTDMPASC